MPPVAADRTRHAATVIGASTAQLAALVVFVLAIPSLFQEGNLVVLGLLWLAIPIIAALTIDAADPPAGSTVHSRLPSRAPTEET
jgi:hypothetical protein